MSFEKVKSVDLYVEKENGERLTVTENPDGPEFGILLHTPDKQSKEWFGEIHLTLSYDEATLLGQTLIDMAYAKANGPISKNENE